MKDLIIVSFPDSDLNEYFFKSREYLEKYISDSSLEINIHGVHGSFNRESLSLLVDKFHDKYGIVIYAHGTTDSILNSKYGDEILTSEEAPKHHNSIFYSTACSNASSLGYTISNYGSKLFFGYDNKSYISSSTDNYIENIFIATDNFALLKILSKEEDCSKISNDTYNFFTSKYNEIKENYHDDAAWLMHNREATKFYKEKKEC